MTDEDWLVRLPLSCSAPTRCISSHKNTVSKLVVIRILVVIHLHLWIHLVERAKVKLEGRVPCSARLDIRIPCFLIGILVLRTIVIQDGSEYTPNPDLMHPLNFPQCQRQMKRVMRQCQRLGKHSNYPLQSSASFQNHR